MAELCAKDRNRMTTIQVTYPSLSYYFSPPFSFSFFIISSQFSNRINCVRFHQCYWGNSRSLISLSPFQICPCLSFSFCPRTEYPLTNLESVSNYSLTFQSNVKITAMECIRVIYLRHGPEVLSPFTLFLSLTLSLSFTLFRFRPRLTDSYLFSFILLSSLHFHP